MYMRNTEIGLSPEASISLRNYIIGRFYSWVGHKEMIPSELKHIVKGYLNMFFNSDIADWLGTIGIYTICTDTVIWMNITITIISNPNYLNTHQWLSDGFRKLPYSDKVKILGDVE